LVIEHLGYREADEVMRKLARNEMLLKKSIEEGADSFLVNLNYAKSLVGSGEEMDKAEIYIDKAIAKLDHIQMDTESIFLAYLTKATILGYNGKVGEALAVLESQREKLQKHDIYKLTTGDLYFKDKQYAKAYSDLRVLMKGSVTISSIPIDLHSITDNLMEQFLVVSLYMGDFIAAEFCINYIFKLENFKVGGGFFDGATNNKANKIRE
jgi:tetratricopeptide (TPR) repeat protein